MDKKNIFSLKASKHKEVLNVFEILMQIASYLLTIKKLF